MNTSKIVLPKQVADAIAHYVALADTKTEALQDILRLGYEAERSQVILRHFGHDYDELMEALICGYEVEKTPEDKVREYYKKVSDEYLAANAEEGDYFLGVKNGVYYTLEYLGIKIEGVNRY